MRNDEDSMIRDISERYLKCQPRKKETLYLLLVINRREFGTINSITLSKSQQWEVEKLTRQTPQDIQQYLVFQKRNSVDFGGSVRVKRIGSFTVAAV